MNKLTTRAASLLLFLLIIKFANGQNIHTDWYSESDNNGIIIQNSYPKGGPYAGPTDKHFNYSYLVFFSRLINETLNPIHLDLEFSADSFAIPGSPDTYVKVFLPADTMTMDKRSLFSYGVTELDSFKHSTSIQRTIDPNEDCLFYVVAIFYQTREEARNQQRGGNRAELVLNGDAFFYNLRPQIESLKCGRIVFNK